MPQKPLVNWPFFFDHLNENKLNNSAFTKKGNGGPDLAVLFQVSIFFPDFEEKCPFFPDFEEPSRLRIQMKKKRIKTGILPRYLLGISQVLSG